MAEKIRLEDRECPLSATLGLVGEWWTLLILHDAFDGFTRFDQFQENLGISSSLLTSRLKRLVATDSSNGASTSRTRRATSTSSATSGGRCGRSSSPWPRGATRASHRRNGAWSSSTPKRASKPNRSSSIVLRAGASTAPSSSSPPDPRRASRSSIATGDGAHHDDADH